ncbi:hypothetical protein ABH926_002668 [Catenulispora sp. GP43]|uniref:AAA family ATPase n=1 Tax=Catenulispora sp. GP43 TaxID=3156263 RepID=UPI0035186143
MTSDPSAAPLYGRIREQEILDRLLHDLHAGRSQALVLRGYTGVGKSALLAYLTGHPLARQVVHTGGVETEPEVAFSALHELCAPLLDRLDRLPAAQRAALSTALGMEAGASPNPLLIGLAVLGLFAEAADGEPLVCVVDDTQWVDGMSAAVLAFVARRLDAEAVAVVFAMTTTAADDLAATDSRLLAGLPELRVERLGEDDARTMLDALLPATVDPGLRDRIVAESHGNPLALVVLSRGAACQ